MAVRYEMWTPLPPERSGIADYSHELLPHLAAELPLTAVTRRPDPDLSPSVPVVGPDRPEAPDTLAIYHMGNHAATHEWIYERALAEPGVVVLHDTSLADFHLRMLGGLHTQAFRDEATYAHGPISGDPADPALIEGWPAIPVDGVPTLDRATLTMERRLAEASRAFIVHDPASAHRLRLRYPDLPVHVVASGAPIRPDGDRATLAEFGWRADDVVFGVFGGLGRIKRPLVALLAFGQVRRRWPQARLLLVGHADDPALAADLHSTIADLGLEASVRIEQSPPMARFEALMSSVDIVVNLRWPTAGETSAVMMRAFGAGRPVITSDLPQHRHLDEAFCWRVPTEPSVEAQRLQALMERVAADPAVARDAGVRAREWAQNTAAWPVVAARYREVLEESRVVSTAPTAPGVNVFADPRATTGLAESARRHIEAMLDAGVRVSFTEFDTRAPNRSLPVPDRIADLPRGKDHPVDLWLVNLNEFQLVPDRALDRYTIALWAWELPQVAPQTIAQLSRVDELWVLSSFVAETFATVTDVPIRVVPSVVPPQQAAVPDRARFGLPEDGLVVLFSFSASSSDARKNPWGLIEAFRRAFTPDERGRTAHLVIKVVDLHRFPELATHLQDAVAAVGGTLIDDELTRAEMDSLLATCDVYASLHRSEGFGLGMAEAMSLGKAVLATGYGGNTDFMPPGAAAVVGFRPRVIRGEDHRFAAAFGDWYRPGQAWADPDVDQAARWLRLLADDPRLRARMAARGKAAVTDLCGPSTVGAIMRTRLTELEADLGQT